MEDPRTEREADNGEYRVVVHFATAAFPRTVWKSLSETAALREARSYLSDAKGVTVHYPDGSIYNVKTGERTQIIG